MDDWTKGCPAIIQAAEASDRLRVGLAMALVPWMKPQTQAEAQFDELRGTAEALGEHPEKVVNAAIIMIRCEGMTVAEACERVKSAMASGWRP